MKLKHLLKFDLPTTVIFKTFFAEHLYTMLVLFVFFKWVYVSSEH